MKALLLSVLLFTTTVGQAQPPTEGVLDRPDVRLHYRIYGQSGPTIVILAGGPGGATAMLQPFADHLKDRFRCVMLEQRGTDRSRLDRYDANTISFDAYIADIEALRVALKQERIILLGSSWGMTLAFAYAGAHPNRVQAIATVGSGTITRDLERRWRDNFQTRLTEEQQQRLRAMSDRDLDPDEAYVEWFKIVAPAYFYKPQEAAKFAAAMQVGDLNGRIPRAAEAMMRQVEQYTVERMSRIVSPVLLIQGRQDLAAEETVTVVRERVKQSRIVLLDECGHMPWLDQPAATWMELDTFLSSFL